MYGDLSNVDPQLVATLEKTHAEDPDYRELVIPELTTTDPAEGIYLHYLSLCLVSPLAVWTLRACVLRRVSVDGSILWQIMPTLHACFAALRTATSDTNQDYRPSQLTNPILTVEESASLYSS
ncbi:hypothetical protein RJZ56_000658 [Blastomyces dermatitidis]